MRNAGIAPPVRTGIMGKIAERLPKPSGEQLFKPRYPSLNLLNRCNASCVTCCEDSNHRPYKPYSEKEALSVLEDLAPKLEPEEKLLHIWGGEPFLMPKLLFGVIGGAVELGYSVNVATNGFWGKDINRARSYIDRAVSITQNNFSLFFSWDGSHSDQKALKPDHIANILSVIIGDGKKVGVSFSCLPFGRSNALKDLEEKVSGITDLPFMICERNLGLDLGDRFMPVFPIGLLTPSLTGRCTRSLAPFFWEHPLSPEALMGDRPMFSAYAIGLDRKMYVSTQLTSGGVLPMGDVTEGAETLAARANADPVAVSLMKHGFNEIFPVMRQLFDADRWIGNFYSPPDILLHLENDDPFAALEAAEDLINNRSGA